MSITGEGRQNKTKLKAHHREPFDEDPGGRPAHRMHRIVKRSRMSPHRVALFSLHVACHDRAVAYLYQGTDLPHSLRLRATPCSHRYVQF